MNASITMSGAASGVGGSKPAGRPDLDRGLGRVGMIAFVGAIAAAVVYVAWSIYSDAAASGVQPTTYRSCCCSWPC
jgi:PiT family inorganic phosphate transporter